MRPMPVITHDFQDAKGIDVMACLYCGRTPVKAKGDHCTARELKELGRIPLRYINPAGVKRFDGRPCATCGENIMDHWVIQGREDWFCDKEGTRVSEGMA